MLKQKNSKTFYDNVIVPLWNKKQNKEFVSNTVEIIAPRLSFNVKLNCKDDMIITIGPKSTNLEYCEKELNWYMSQSLSIIGYMENVKIWNHVCSKDGKKEINSNYGWCIMSKENGNQYKNCIEELKRDKCSRKALMIYNRPSMHIDHKREGMSDFICTTSVHLLIRDNKLIYIVNQRSMDCIFGFFNDYYWHCYVANLAMKSLDLNETEIIYIPESAHIYESHYNLLDEMYEKGKEQWKNYK